MLLKEAYDIVIALAESKKEESTDIPKQREEEAITIIKDALSTILELQSDTNTSTTTVYKI